MMRAMRLHASRPLSWGALLNIVSAVLFTQPDRNPQVEALSICCWTSLTLCPYMAAASISSVTTVWSCFSAHLRTCLSAGTFDMK